MCGIFGIIGKTDVVPAILCALKNLEYRGYDSAGLSVIHEGKIERRRTVGKVFRLEEEVERNPLSGYAGIGHTRWATHGAPTEPNAHPHMTDHLAIVHNGIIENFRELREELNQAGIDCSSETDSEVIGQLLTRELKEGKTPAEAMRSVLDRLSGSFAFLVLFQGKEAVLAAVQRGAPLVIGLGEGEEVFVASDTMALAPFTSRVVYLRDGDWALLNSAKIHIFNDAGEPVQRAETRLSGEMLTASKGNHRHFMHKEIHEQPRAIAHTLGRYLSSQKQGLCLPDGLPQDILDGDHLLISGCGTAYYAGLVGKYWFERLAGLSVDIDVGSEFRYRNIAFKSGGTALFISQSGETADTLAALRYCRAGGQRVGAIVNVPESTMGREADFLLPTLAGPEIGVASTKAFTCQLSVLLVLALIAGRRRGLLDDQNLEAHLRSLDDLPRLCSEILNLEPHIEELARVIVKGQHVLYLGRGANYPLALEGALKLKELSYIHAEGYAAGELKHGPIALIDENMPVVVIAPYDRFFDKIASNIQEISARGGRLILFTDKKGSSFGLSVERLLIMPDMPELVNQIAYALPMQLLAYHIALQRGTDVDQPRHLAKSVTVE